MKAIFKKLNFILLCLAFVLSTTACGSSSSGSSSTFTTRTGSAVKNLDESDSDDEADEDDAQEEKTSSTDATEYIIQAIDMTAETITAMSIDGSQQVRYSYGLTTSFLDKYGNTYNSSHFTPGQVVTFGERNSSGILTSVQMSADVWVYSDVIRYSIDEDRGVFTIATTNYRITENVLVFSGDDEAEMADIGGGETLQVIGKDTDIISVVITTGCGTILLTNTETFDGSLIFIGNKVITNVSEGLEIEVQEGDYDITVANNGYGSTATYTVVANETTTIDLEEEMKGDGSSICLLTVETSVESASVYIDGSKIETGVEIEVAYGNHRLVVIADGYSTWSKTLVVNSSSATISLTLDEEEEEDEDDEDEDDEADDEVEDEED